MAKKPVGRPSSYNANTAALICELIAQGNSLVKICQQEGMPEYRTVLRWLAANEEFRRNYTCAREDQADTLADECLDIADNKGSDFKKDANGELMFDEAGNPIIDHDNIQRARLQIDTRKWYAGKLKPKKYGDKQINEHSGPDGGAIPVGIQVTFK